MNPRKRSAGSRGPFDVIRWVSTGAALFAISVFLAVPAAAIVLDTSGTAPDLWYPQKYCQVDIVLQSEHLLTKSYKFEGHCGTGPLNVTVPPDGYILLQIYYVALATFFFNPYVNQGDGAENVSLYSDPTHTYKLGDILTTFSCTEDPFSSQNAPYGLSKPNPCTVTAHSNSSPFLVPSTTPNTFLPLVQGGAKGSSVGTAQQALSGGDPGKWDPGKEEAKWIEITHPNDYEHVPVSTPPGFSYNLVLTPILVLTPKGQAEPPDLIFGEFQRATLGGYSGDLSFPPGVPSSWTTISAPLHPTSSVEWANLAPAVRGGGSRKVPLYTGETNAPFTPGLYRVRVKATFGGPGAMLQFSTPWEPWRYFWVGSIPRAVKKKSPGMATQVAPGPTPEPRQPAAEATPGIPPPRGIAGPPTPPQVAAPARPATPGPPQVAPGRTPEPRQPAAETVREQVEKLSELTQRLTPHQQDPEARLLLMAVQTLRRDLAAGPEPKEAETLLRDAQRLTREVDRLEARRLREQQRAAASGPAPSEPAAPGAAAPAPGAEPEPGQPSGPPQVTAIPRPAAPARDPVAEEAAKELGTLVRRLTALGANREAQRLLREVQLLQRQLGSESGEAPAILREAKRLTREVDRLEARLRQPTTPPRPGPQAPSIK